MCEIGARLDRQQRLPATAVANDVDLRPTPSPRRSQVRADPLTVLRPQAVPPRDGGWAGRGGMPCYGRDVGVGVKRARSCSARALESLDGGAGCVSAGWSSVSNGGSSSPLGCGAARSTGRCMATRGSSSRRLLSSRRSVSAGALRRPRCRRAGWSVPASHREPTAAHSSYRRFTST
jgi:hypothetical protein